MRGVGELLLADALPEKRNDPFDSIIIAGQEGICSLGHPSKHPVNRWIQVEYLLHSGAGQPSVGTV